MNLDTKHFLNCGLKVYGLRSSFSLFFIRQISMEWLGIEYYPHHVTREGVGGGDIRSFHTLEFNFLLLFSGRVSKNRYHQIPQKVGDKVSKPVSGLC